MVKLYKSLYSFKASYNSALSFQEGEIFVELSENGKKDRNWYFVASNDGRSGYVPRNYVAEVTSYSAADTFAFINEARISCFIVYIF